MELLQHCRAECSFLWLVLPSILTLLCSITNAMRLGNETDLSSLLAFKAGFECSATHNILSSWNVSSHFCEWEGVTCGRRHSRVTALNLQKSGLKGTISPYIGNLSFLRRLELQENNMQGHLPQEIGHLSRLQVLNISRNSLQGIIPVNLSHCSKLRHIDLNANELVGELPVELTILPNLIFLSVHRNSLRGAISPSLANLSALEYLSLGSNKLTGGIPFELGRLHRLKHLHLGLNFLSGTIPSSIYNLSSLEKLQLGINKLQGSLPSDIGLQFPNLQLLSFSENQLTGSLPNTLSNASCLVAIGLDNNAFTGKIPNNLGKLRGLVVLELSWNQLLEEGNDLKIVTSLTNCTKLGVLGLLGNLLNARLPESTSNLSTHLHWLTLGSNKLFGKIPSGIGKLVGMEFLVLENNSLTGNIPPIIWTLPRLEVLYLGGNKLSGKIPSCFCNNSHLISLYLGGNNLEGHIPPSIGQCDKLEKLSLEENKLDGTIPKELFTLPSLSIFLSLSSNFLSGHLPSEIGNMKILGILKANNNNFSGKIPTTLGSCQSLRELYLGNNAFEGFIPSSLSSMTAIEVLDLSHNNLSGPIPIYMEKFKYLYSLDLSFNNFEGEVPKGRIFLNSSGISLVGNNRICGGPQNLHLSACTTKKAGKKKRSTHLCLVIPIICISIVVLVTTCIVAICWKRISKDRVTSKNISEEKYWRVSYQDLLKATNGFSDECLIGSGGYGSVYKVTFEQERTVAAVKVLNLQVKGSSRTFEIECKTLSKIRHRNLVKILTSCASLDHRGNDFKALIFQYMSNGSLQDWLHGNNEGRHQVRTLNTIERFNIAIDVATALDYLHNQCDKPIVHCDLKPSNVLLDDEMVAHVADFGLAKILHESSSSFTDEKSSSVLVKGTIGYVPPEYGEGNEVSVQGDVYSYGILLLEIFTRKRPTDAMFIDALNLHSYIEAALPDRIFEIVDGQLQLENGTSTHESVINSIASVLSVGVSCSAASPQERPTIKDVLKQMHDIRDAFLTGSHTNSM